MEQVTVSVYAGEDVVYAQVPAWIQVDSPTSWRGYLIAAEGQSWEISGMNTVHPVLFLLKTVDGRSGQIFIDAANTQTREVHFEGKGPFGLMQ